MNNKKHVSPGMALLVVAIFVALIALATMYGESRNNSVPSQELTKLQKNNQYYNIKNVLFYLKVNGSINVDGKLPKNDSEIDKILDSIRTQHKEDQYAGALAYLTEIKKLHDATKELIDWQIKLDNNNDRIDWAIYWLKYLNKYRPIEYIQLVASSKENREAAKYEFAKNYASLILELRFSFGFDKMKCIERDDAIIECIKKLPVTGGFVFNGFNRSEDEAVWNSWQTMFYNLPVKDAHQLLISLLDVRAHSAYNTLEVPRGMIESVQYQRTINRINSQFSKSLDEEEQRARGLMDVINGIINKSRENKEKAQNKIPFKYALIFDVHELE
jgi:hypothetical protein